MFQLLKVGDSGRFSHHSYRIELKMSNNDFLRCLNGEMDMRGVEGDLDAKSLHSIFVHELSHFWQIASTRSTLMLMMFYWNLLRDLCKDMKGIISLPIQEPRDNPHYELIKFITREIEGVADLSLVGVSCTVPAILLPKRRGRERSEKILLRLC